MLDDHNTSLDTLGTAVRSQGGGGVNLQGGCRRCRHGRPYSRSRRRWRRTTYSCRHYGRQG
eukprot:1529436-Rhodomonas_salina.1